MVEDSELWDIILDEPFIPTSEVKDGAEEYLSMNQQRRSGIVLGIHMKILSRMKEGKLFMTCILKLSIITNELRSLGEPISTRKQVRKVLRIISKSLESKVDVVAEAKDLKVLTMDALIGNLKKHEMNRSQDLSKEAKKDKSLVLKFNPGEASSEEDDMTYLTKRFQKIIRKNRGFRKEGNPARAATASDSCHKCGKFGYFIRECPMLKAEIRSIKDSSSESGDSDCPEDTSMLVIQDEANVFNGMFAFMAKSDEDDHEDKKLQGGGVYFGNGKNGYILGVGKVGKSLEDSIENVYYVSVLKHNILIVSQIYDKGNEVKFLSDK
ncbi:uncharacterized protein LOC107017680 [Solanum pennellii]|uniref:Uncharacterized protein LOC107017680 n=1 Tax=Solanum pennellii TaxID=28526 RepID=A0ABM1GMS5_SOLPN|nr:uncharacterized protein LOC107017680 [Solanum pennellii]